MFAVYLRLLFDLFRQTQLSVRWTYLRSAAPTSLLQVLMPDDSWEPGSSLELVNIACAEKQMMPDEQKRKDHCRRTAAAAAALTEADLCLGRWAGRCWAWRGRLAAPPSIQSHTPSYTGWTCTAADGGLQTLHIHSHLSAYLCPRVYK